MASKNAGISENLCGSLLVTMLLQVPHLLRFSANTFALDFINSLATIKLSLFKSELISVLFPPGAAHKSKIFKFYEKFKV
jgi:hypothetical protein